MIPTTGAKKPTWRYPRFVWNGITTDFEDPLASAPPPESSPVAGTGITASGRREVVTERDERGVVLVTNPMPAEDCAEFQRFIEEWASQGRQFECYVDRVLRAWWGFDDYTPYDNNRANHFELANHPGSALSYATLTRGKGVTLPAAGVLRAALISRLAGGSGNEFLAADEGTLVLQVKPDWAFADGAEHVLLDCAIEGAEWKNRVRLVKRADNVLHFVYAGSNGAETIVEAIPAWDANTEHTLMAQWKALADLKLRVDDTISTTKRYPLVADASRIAGTGLIAGQTSGVANGVETTMDNNPELATLGTDLAGQHGRGTGVYGMLACYTAALELPDLWRTFSYPWRSYFAKAELVDPSYRATRTQDGQELFRYQLRIRDGR